MVLIWVFVWCILLLCPILDVIFMIEKQEINNAYIILNIALYLGFAVSDLERKPNL